MHDSHVPSLLVCRQKEFGWCLSTQYRTYDQVIVQFNFNGGVAREVRLDLNGTVNLQAHTQQTKSVISVSMSRSESSRGSAGHERLV